MSTSVSPRPQAAPRGSSAEVTTHWVSQLDDVRRRVVRQRTWTAVCWGGAELLAALLAMAAADWAWEISTSARAAWLALVVALVGTGVFFSIARWARRYQTADAAVALEHLRPEYGQRLRTAFDYATPHAATARRRPAPAHPALVTAVVDEATHLTRPADLDQAETSPSMFLAAGWLGLAAVACAVGLLLGPETRTAAGRVLLLPWDYTTVTFEPAQRTVHQGESVAVAVEVAGRPVGTAQLHYRPAYRPAADAGAWTEIPLLPPDTTAEDRPAQLTGSLVATIPDCQADVEFQVVAGPRKLPLGQIRVLQPLAVEQFQARIQPPAYSGRAEETTDRRELKVWEGSDIHFEVRMSRAVADAKLISLAARGKSATERSPEAAPALTAEADPAAAPDRPATEETVQIDGPVLRGKLTDIRQSVTMEVTARTADGVTADPLRLVVRVQLDGKPQIRFVQPPEEWEVTPTTEVTMAIEASDDVGLHKIGVMCQVGEGPLQTLWEHDAGGADEPFQAAPVLMLEEHPVTFQDGVTYFAFAEDNYFGEPRRSLTPLRFIDIRPYKRAYQLLDTGGT